MTDTSTLIGPAIAVVIMVGGWLLAQSRDERGQPIRGRVSLGQGMASLGLVGGLLTLPTDLPPSTYAVGVALVLLWGLLLVRGAGRLAIGWTSMAEVVTRAVGLAWVRPARAVWSAACLAAGLWVAGWLAGQGHPAAALLGALVVLAPARWLLPRGYARESATTEVEIAAAGLLSGGQEWQADEAAQRGAPVRLRFDRDDRPLRLSFRLPPAWRGDSEESLVAELRRRLGAWGVFWAVEVDHSRRRVAAVRAEPLPELVGVPTDRTLEWIEANKPSPLAIYLGEGQDPETGLTSPLWWDPDAHDPHVLVGGKTKSGKTIGLRLAVAQAVSRGWDVIICDPKGVDFVWAGRLAGVRYYPGESCLDGIREAVGEMRERQSWLQRNLWSGKTGADEEGDLLKVPGHPYRPCLVILDEAAEATGLGTKEEQAETKANMSSLARLSRFAGMMCAYGTQRPDVGFISGEAKANLGTRLMYGGGGATLCNMVLEKAQKELRKLTATCRGRARAVIAEGDAIEFQGAMVSAASVKRLAGGVLPPDRLAPMRFTPEPEWRKWVRDGAQDADLAERVKPHPDYDRAAADLDEKMEELAEKFEGDVSESDDRPAGKPSKKSDKKRAGSGADSDRGSRSDSEPESEREPDNDSDSQGDEGDPMQWFEE